MTEGKGSIAGRAVVLAVMVANGACGRRAPIASCDDDLRGVYVAGGERWMVIDRGATLEAYPLFPDGAPDPAAALAGVVAAPRVIDLGRAPAGTPAGSSVAGGLGSDPPLPAREAALAGTLRRRYMRGAAACEARVPVHITRCADDTLELVLADPAPPVEFSPCTWSRPGPSRLVRWRRE